MSWFDTLQRCSFRGVECLWEAADGDLGRRVAVFEYPGRDLPYVEDLGRRARVWTLELIVAGAGYMAARNRLIEALEAPGPGRLVHPTLGELTVAVLEARGPRESTRDGGLARFSVTFIEAGDNRYPAYAVDGRTRVSAAADAAEEALASDMEEALDLAGPGWIAQAAIDRVVAIADTVRRGIAALPEISGAAAVVEALQEITGAAAALITAPIDLVQQVADLWGAVVTAAERPILALDALEQYWQLDGDLGLPISTPSRLQDRANQEALNGMLAASAVIAGARAATAADYDSQEAADAARETVAAGLDRVMLAAGDALYAALSDLRAAVVADLGSRPGLPRTQRLTLPADLPALVLAYRLYEDAGRDADLVARNRIAHPGFVPGGRPLEVLNA